MMGDALAPLFTSRTRVRLLARLIADPEKRYGVRDLARLIRLGAAGVSRELRKLHRMGLLRDARRGPGVLYSINTKHAWYGSLRKLFERA